MKGSEPMGRTDAFKHSATKADGTASISSGRSARLTGQRFRAREDVADAADLCRVVRVTGRVDATTGNAVLHRLLSAVSPGRTILLDLSGVETLDGAGVDILDAARRQACITGGDLRVCRPPHSTQGRAWRTGQGDLGRPLEEVVSAGHHAALSRQVARPSRIRALSQEIRDVAGNA